MHVVAGSIPAEYHGVIRGIHLSGHFLRNPTFEAVRTGFHRRTNDCWFESNFGGFPESLSVEQPVVCHRKIEQPSTRSVFLLNSLSRQ